MLLALSSPARPPWERSCFCVAGGEADEGSLAAGRLPMAECRPLERTDWPWACVDRERGRRSWSASWSYSLSSVRAKVCVCVCGGKDCGRCCGEDGEPEQAACRNYVVCTHSRRRGGEAERGGTAASLLAKDN